MNSSRRRIAERRGRAAELWVAVCYRVLGYHVLDRRWRSRVGEIDLIVCRGRSIVFVEVKYRPTRDDGLYALGFEKRRRLCNAARLWMARNASQREDRLFRFDLAIVTPWGRIHRCHHAFGADDGAFLLR